MKKEVEGYIARYNDDILFSNQPMRKGGFFGDGDMWYDTLEKEENSPLDLRVDMHNYLDIPELTFENSPRRCKLTIEIGEQLPGNDQREIDRRVKAMRIRGNIRERLRGLSGLQYAYYRIILQQHRHLTSLMKMMERAKLFIPADVKLYHEQIGNMMKYNGQKQKK